MAVECRDGSGPTPNSISGFASLSPNSALPRRDWLSAAAAHGRQEFGVGFGLAHLVEQELHGFHGGQGIENLSQDPDSRQFVLGNQQFFLAGCRSD